MTAQPNHITSALHTFWDPSTGHPVIQGYRMAPVGYRIEWLQKQAWHGERRIGRHNVVFQHSAVGEFEMALDEWVRIADILQGVS